MEYRKSSLAGLSPSAVVRDGVVFVPLKIYLDGSEAPQIRMTLGSVVADEAVWSELEPAWDEALRRHDVPYSHMKDLTGRREPFVGWTSGQCEAFVSDLVAVLEQFRSGRIRQYACWVDLQAHRRWARTRNHPAPARLCARILFPTFLDDFPGIIDAIDAWFDQNEPFMTHLREDWQNPRVRADAPVWKLVRTMAPADMRTVPPLQMADLIAWSRNRYEAARPKLAASAGIDPLTVLAARVINHGLKGLHQELDEDTMAKGSFPEEGLRRRALFERARKRHV